MFTYEGLFPKVLWPYIRSFSLQFKYFILERTAVQVIINMVTALNFRHNIAVV